MSKRFRIAAGAWRRKPRTENVPSPYSSRVKEFQLHNVAHSTHGDKMRGMGSVKKVMHKTSGHVTN